MKFTLMRVLDSLAGVLKKGYPEYPVYIEPGIQETELPCFFLFLMPSEISGETGAGICGTWVSTLYLCSSGISRMETGGCFLRGISGQGTGLFSLYGRKRGYGSDPYL